MVNNMILRIAQEVGATTEKGGKITATSCVCFTSSEFDYFVQLLAKRLEEVSTGAVDRFVGNS